MVPGTRDVYMRSWNRFHKFAQQYGLQTLPASSDTIALFISYLAPNYAYSSIRTFVSAIAYHQKINGFPDPTQTFYIQKALSGLKKSKPDYKQSPAITITILHDIINSIQQQQLASHQKALFRALCLTAFFALCRVSEIAETPAKHNLQFQDVSYLPKPPRFVICFKSFKHSTSPAAIALNEQHPINICPVHALRMYIQKRGSAPGPLFITSSNKPISRKDITDILHNALALKGYNPKLYTTHSLRIGGATHAAKLGLSPLLIQRLGRWNSSAYLRYIRW